MYSFIELWLGCLDPTMSGVLWQSCLSYYDELFQFINVDVIEEPYGTGVSGVLTPEGNAFLIIFGLYYTTYTIDEFTFPVYQPINPVQFTASGAYILTFPENLSGAPCTQQTFP